MVRRRVHIYGSGIKNHRRGAIAPLAAFFMIVILAITAFAVDIGYILVAQSDLQRSADAAAHAAVLELRASNLEIASSEARSVAQQYASTNKIINCSATVDANLNNADRTGDILVGRIDVTQPRSAMTFDHADEANAVRVRIRRNDSRNGSLSLFFARMLGVRSISLESSATAAVINSVSGFEIAKNGENAPILPITVHEDHWRESLEEPEDSWAYDPVSGSVSPGSDQVPEVVIFPNETGSSGNLGTLNIGTSSNSTSFLGNQIRNGVSQADMDYHGGTLELNSSGELPLSGNPGLSAGIKDDLAAIAGKPLVIPIYRNVSGNGNNAVFRIVGFEGVRLMAVNLTGKDKFVAVQPAPVTYRGLIQSQAGQGRTSEGVYSPPMIVQ
jgi:Flp pilus assembly protein TadG